VGTVMAGHDGRRGYIYHTAVAPHRRKEGIGTLLVTKALQILKEEGITVAALVVFSDNEAGNAFWEKMGFVIRDEVIYRNIHLK